MNPYTYEQNTLDPASAGTTVGGTPVKLVEQGGSFVLVQMLYVEGKDDYLKQYRKREIVLEFENLDEKSYFMANLQHEHKQFMDVSDSGSDSDDGLMFTATSRRVRLRLSLRA